MQNPYIPYPVTIDDIIIETADRNLKTFKFVFDNPGDEEKFAYHAGQFAELSILGYGESPIGIASSPTEKGFVSFTVNKVGLVTSKMHQMEVGDKMGVRGPLGNWYPLEFLKGKNVVIVGGGFAFTTLRSLATFMLHPDHRADYGKITMFYGARNPGLLLYKETLDEWKKSSEIDLNLTVDPGGETPEWDGHVGFVPDVVGKAAPSSENAVAIICGPPIMIRFTLPKLKELGFEMENIITSLEARMKCGIGKCGRCNIGSKYVCKDGPVFTYAELQELPNEY